jgi:polar amino acid transport system permease protein
VERDARSLSADEVSALTVTPRRHYGRWGVAAALAVLVFLGLQSVLANKNINWSAVADYLFDPQILRGLQHTLIITVCAMGIALVLGTVVAAMRTSSNQFARWVAGTFAFAFRSTPVLVQLFFWFNLALIWPRLGVGIPGTSLTLGGWDTNTVMTPLVASIVGLGLSESAYYSEVVRSGLISVDPGQREAAQSIGMTEFQTFRKIVLPQTVRIILPPTGNELIAMLKFSSLASVIGYTDLAGTAAQIYSVNLLTVELLIVISIWYFVATSILSIGQYFLEKRFGRGYGPSVQHVGLGSRIRNNLRFRKGQR